MNENLHKCANLECERLTTADYCCAPCRMAAEGGYEIHPDGPLGHSEGCDKRHMVRFSRRLTVMSVPTPSKGWLDSCDFCENQESGGHYCLLYSRQMKNMNTLRCSDWQEKRSGGTHVPS